MHSISMYMFLISSILFLQLRKRAFYNVSTRNVKEQFSQITYFSTPTLTQRDPVNKVMLIVFRMTSVALDTIVKVALPVVALVGK